MKKNLLLLLITITLSHCNSLLSMKRKNPFSNTEQEKNKKHKISEYRLKNPSGYFNISGQYNNYAVFTPYFQSSKKNWIHDLSTKKWVVKEQPGKFHSITDNFATFFSSSNKTVTLINLNNQKTTVFSNITLLKLYLENKKLFISGEEKIVLHNTTTAETITHYVQEKKLSNLIAGGKYMWVYDEKLSKTILVDTKTFKQHSRNKNGESIRFYPDVPFSILKNKEGIHLYNINNDTVLITIPIKKEWEVFSCNKNFITFRLDSLDHKWCVYDVHNKKVIHYSLDKSELDKSEMDYRIIAPGDFLLRIPHSEEVISYILDKSKMSHQTIAPRKHWIFRSEWGSLIKIFDHDNNRLHAIESEYETNHSVYRTSDSISPSGEWFLLPLSNGTCALYDLKKDTLDHTIALPEEFKPDTITRIEFTQNNKIILFTNEKKEHLFYNIITEKALDIPHKLIQFCVSQTKPFIWYMTENNILHLYDYNENKVRLTVTAPDGALPHCFFNTKGTQIFFPTKNTTTIIDIPDFFAFGVFYTQLLTRKNRKEFTDVAIKYAD